jgi:DNA polymerase-3 subunit delta'
MSLRGISCQYRAIKAFQNAITNNRVAHAYIFTGQEGVGKALFSKELAKIIFCRHRNIDACDTCNTCQRITNNNFPDLFLILPEKNSRVIKIEQLKYLQDILNIKPLESKYKMVVIKSADKMNEEASNCLLKTLEEPPSYAIIILIVTSLESLKETIRSRCQVIRFSPLSTSAVKDILVNNFQLDSTQAERLASISNGSIKRAMLLFNADSLKKKNWLIDRLLKLEYGDNLTFSKELFYEWNIQDLEILEEKRLYVKELILSFLLYYRDLLVCRIENKELPLYHTEWREALVSKGRSIPEDTLFSIFHVIRASLEQLDYNANINLLLENMITKILRLQFPSFS